MKPGRKSSPDGVHYRVAVADLHAHLYRVRLTVIQPANVQSLRLPVWIPGSYLIREFAKNLQRLVAHQGKRSCAVRQCDKNSWEVDCRGDAPLVVEYEVYALDNSVRSAWLDASRGFFNGTSLFLQVDGHETLTHDLELGRNPRGPALKVATHWVRVKL